MLNLNDVYYFTQVVDKKGFAAAARALGMPKSTLSKRIAELEKTLGTRLLLRSARSFTVSKIGLEFHKHAAAMLMEAEAAERAVRTRMAEPSGTVRVTLSMTTAQIVMASVLTRLAKRFPKIHLEMHTTNRFVSLIDEGFDIAVRAHYGELPDSGLVQRSLGRSPMYLIAAPAYVKAHGAPRLPEEIAHHEALLTAPSTEPAVWKLHHLQGKTFEATAHGRYSLAEPVTLLQAAVAGLGIACLPKALCSSAIEAGTLTRVLPEWSAKGALMTLLTPHRRLQLPAVSAVLDLLSTELSATMALESDRKRAAATGTQSL